MEYDDPDFSIQKDRLAHLFPDLSFSDGDAFAEINMFPIDPWEAAKEGSIGLYIHRYGASEFDDRSDDASKNDQYRRISTPFDWPTRGRWCREGGNACTRRDNKIRFRYTLVHEGAHDVTANHLLDRFQWVFLPSLHSAFFQTHGVLEGHALFIEEIAGRRRKDLKLDRTHRVVGDYYQLPTPDVDSRKSASELATSENVQGTAEALLTAFRDVEDALDDEVDHIVYKLERVRRETTRKMFNNSLHWFTFLHDAFGRSNGHVDFCEVRSEVHRRVWLLRTALNPAAPFSSPQPKIDKAFNDMDIGVCLRRWYADKQCMVDTGGSAVCREVSCEFSPGDSVSVLIPPSAIPDGVGSISCTIEIGDWEVGYSGGAIQVCVKVEFVVFDVPIMIEFCTSISL